MASVRNINLRSRTASHHQVPSMPCLKARRLALILRNGRNHRHRRRSKACLPWLRILHRPHQRVSDSNMADSQSYLRLSITPKGQLHSLQPSLRRRKDGVVGTMELLRGSSGVDLALRPTGLCICTLDMLFAGFERSVPPTRRAMACGRNWLAPARVGMTRTVCFGALVGNGALSQRQNTLLQWVHSCSHSVTIAYVCV